MTDRTDSGLTVPIRLERAEDAAVVAKALHCEARICSLDAERIRSRSRRNKTVEMSPQSIAADLRAATLRTVARQFEAVAASATKETAP